MLNKSSLYLAAMLAIFFHIFSGSVKASMVYTYDLGSTYVDISAELSNSISRSKIYSIVPDPLTYNFFSDDLDTNAELTGEIFGKTVILGHSWSPDSAIGISVSQVEVLSEASLEATTYGMSLNLLGSASHGVVGVNPADPCSDFSFNLQALAASSITTHIVVGPEPVNMCVEGTVSIPAAGILGDFDSYRCYLELYDSNGLMLSLYNEPNNLIDYEITLLPGEYYLSQTVESSYEIDIAEHTEIWEIPTARSLDTSQDISVTFAIAPEPCALFLMATGAVIFIRSQKLSKRH